MLYVDGEWVPYTPPKEGDLVSGATTSNASLPVVAAKPDTHDQYDKRALCVARFGVVCGPLFPVMCGVWYRYTTLLVSLLKCRACVLSM